MAIRPFRNTPTPWPSPCRYTTASTSRRTNRRWLSGLVIVLFCGIAFPDAQAHYNASRMDRDQAIAEMERLLAVEMEAQGLPSLVVAIVRGSEVLHTIDLGLADRATQRKATSQTRYRIGSLTKPITATLTLALAEDGLLSLDDPITHWLDQTEILPNPAWAGEVNPGTVTIRHLLTHFSGLPRNPPNLSGAGRDPFAGYSEASLDKALAELMLEWPAGLYVNYSNFGFAILARILERASGEPFAHLLERRLLRPLGMAQSSFQVPDRRVASVGYRITDIDLVEDDWDMGALAPAGGLYASSSDLAQFLTLFLDHAVSCRLGISPQAIDQMLSPTLNLRNSDVSMALGWFHHRVRDTDIYWHTGVLAGHFAYLAVVPEARVGVVALTNRQRDFDPLGGWLARRAAAIFGENRRD